MKKFKVLIGALCLGITLVACGKNEYVSKTEELISAIGDVNENSKDAITAALNQYNALSDKDKSAVSNYSILESASAAYEEIEAQQEQILAEQEQTQKENAKKAIDEAFDALILAKAASDDIISIINEYWDYNMWESFYDYATYEKNMRAHAKDKSGNNPRGSFYGDAKATFDDRDLIKTLLERAKTNLNMSSIPEEYKNYLEAVKQYYFKVDAYCSFASDFPTGYSYVTYGQAYSQYQSELETLKSAAEFAK